MPTPATPAPTVSVARWAMATRFEIVLHGPNPIALRGAGDEALNEIQRLETQLNLYAASSEMARINALAAREPVRVEPGLFRLLQQAARIQQETDGLFDITVAPLMKCWGFMGASGALPSPDALEDARSNVGMALVEFDEKAFTVRFQKQGVMLDLGAIGKGYAIEQAAEILREDGITSALIHGGTSTVYALGHPPDQPDWKVAIEFADPSQTPGSAVTNLNPHSTPGDQENPDKPNPDASPHSGSQILSVVSLRDEALSVSAVWGKAFQSENKILGHVIDPRTGHPADNAMLGAVILPSATETDAFSTALLVGGREALEILMPLRPAMRALVAGKDRESGEIWTETRGLPTSAG